MGGMENKVTLTDNGFLINGQSVRIIAGAVHYFRVPRAYWRDRLLKLKAMGCNAVETYVAWNLHEPKPGKYDFSDNLDLEAYLRLAHELGLYALVRPGPYICAEWEFGGLPWWLLREDMSIRCMDKRWLRRVGRWFGELIPRVATLQVGRGGPVVAVQVENEYGSFGNDSAYLEHLRALIAGLGIDSALLYTSDGPSDWMLQGGTLEGVFKTANFGSRPAEAFAKLREYQKDGPLMCAEYWNGWFDHWNGPHHTRDAADAAQVLDEMLAAGASVSLYMFHGGTNFGFMAGANHYDALEPTITSYDYDSPLSESGELTAKYHAFRDVIAKYAPIPEVSLLPPTPLRAFGTVELTERAGLFDNLSRLGRRRREPAPYPMEKLGQGYGFILYRTAITGPREEQPLVLQDVHDRALVFVDGKYLGVLGWASDQEIRFAVPPQGCTVDVLVENMGRANYGNNMWEPKGITKGIRHGQQYLYGYDIHLLPMDDLTKLRYRSTPQKVEGSAFYRGSFTVDQPADTFLRLDGWEKGVAFINGFNLGRYWKAGPQKTLYVPAPLLKAGENELVIFELHGAQAPVVTLTDKPDLG